MITVFAYYTREFQPLADITIPSLRRYCQKHGYDFTLHCGGFGDRTRIFSFQKTEMALALLKGSEFLFVVDIDILITNHLFRLESIIDDDHDLFACHDVNGFNSGLYLIRRSDASTMFLLSVLSLRGSPGVIGEQDAMRDLIAQQAIRFKQLPHPSINSYLYEEYGMIRHHREGEWQPGDFVLHLPGRSNDRRIEIFTSEQIQQGIIE